MFTRKNYKDTVVDSLRYCQEQKGLELYSWCIMSNHVHLVASASEGFKMSAILRDMKKHTSKQIIKAIHEQPESRRDWLLLMMKTAALKNSKKQEYQLWRNDNHPIVLYRDKVIQQKIDYIHHNPVESGIVMHPEDYIYSSARNYAGLDGLLTLNL